MMDTGSLVLFFGIAFAVIATGLFISVSTIRQMNRAMREIAEKLGGAFQEGGLFDEPEAAFTLAGCRAWIRDCRGNRTSFAFMRVVVDLRNRASGKLRISPMSFARAFERRFGPPYVSAGDADFDRDYVVESVPAWIASRVFAPTRRAEVIATVRRLEGLEHPSIDLDGDYLVLEVREYGVDQEQLMRLVRTAGEFVGYLLDSAPLAGIMLEDVRVSSGGECPVCGSAMNEGVIRCEACRTPHHRECWQYMGRCTTYACRGRRFVA